MINHTSEAGSIVFAPILHGKLPFALAVREIFFRERPDCVAVELPETLRTPLERALRRLPLLSLLRYNEADGQPAFVLIEPCDGIIEALRLAREHGVPWFPIDRDTEDYGQHPDRLPDPHALERLGYEKYVAEVAPVLGKLSPSDQDAMREATMAYHLQQLSRKHRKVLVVCGLGHVHRLRQRLQTSSVRPLGRTHREDVQVFHLHEQSSREVLSEPGWIQDQFEKWRKAYPEGTPPEDRCDRYRLLQQLLLEARDRMLKEDGESVGPKALQVALQFARNQALLRAALAPDLVEIVTAARGVHSDDFAWHLWDLATSYPHQADPADLPTYRATLEELAKFGRNMHFYRRIKTRRHMLRLVRMRAKEDYEGQWKESGSGSYTCSYPPEDIRIEAFGSFLRKRAKGIIAASRARVVPFSTSLCDGIDLRETIRNMPRDGRLYVREEMPLHGEVSAIVVIFDEKDDKNRYSWTMTWQGEHDQESDMALFATPPDLHLVGPGIARCEYGGFLMTYPPGRMFSVFEDPYFEDAETKAERLLLAAIDYAQERWVLYVAARPPRSRIVQRARRAGKQVMYLPIGQLSPQTLRQLRVFHVLDGRHVRSYAKDFI